MKLANTSFIHTSLNHRIVTRSPNHMCAVSCAMTLARSSNWFCVADSSSMSPDCVVEDGAGVLHAAELKRRNQDDVELAPRVADRRCSPRATPARAHADRRSHRGCAPLWPRRSRDETSAASGRRAGAVSIENLPATNANRYVGSGGVSANSNDRRASGPVCPPRCPRPASRRAPSATACSAPSGPAGRSRGTPAAPARERTACRETRRCGSGPRRRR